MIKWNVGMKIGTGFALALAILLAIGAASYRNTAKLTATADMVVHTHKVLEGVIQLVQALVDVETGNRGYIITGAEAYLEPYQSGLAAVDKSVEEIRSLTQDNSSQQRRLDLLEPLISEKLASLKTGIELRKAKGFAAARDWLAAGKGKKEMDEIRKIIRGMESEENALLKTRLDEAHASARNTTLTIVFGTLAAFIVLAVAGFVITRNIANPLKAIAATAERVAAGDLDVSISVNNRADEVGMLVRTFARMTENLRGQIRGIVEGINVLGSSASEISASTTQFAASATETAAAVVETTTTVEEIRQTAQVSSQKAKAVSETAQKVAQITQSGKKSTEDAVEGMARIRLQMESIAESMVRLSEQSQAIGQIVATVEDLAAQSNLLAVNAAIEAAKAGEHGKGFAVVAQEVKSLAEQSKQATNQVRTILNDIQKATSGAVMATEQGSKAVEAGGKQSAQAGQSIQTLVGSVAEAAQAATQIAASSQQQLLGVDQVAAAMESIKQTSVQNVDSARQMESAARNLKELGEKLKQLVEHYNV
jgi:methyl-accepting chemotaxis protein